MRTEDNSVRFQTPAGTGGLLQKEASANTALQKVRKMGRKLKSKRLPAHYCYAAFLEKLFCSSP
jgi:hypothetical protein